VFFTHNRYVASKRERGRTTSTASGGLGQLQRVKKRMVKKRDREGAG